MKEKSLFGQIAESRKENRRVIKKGKEEGYLYDYTSPNGIWAYEQTFQNIIDEPWDEFLKEQKEKYGLTAAMDFMGGGSCFNNLQWLDKKLAVRLLDNGPNLLFQLPAQEKERLLEVDVIAGDVLSKRTWKEISLWAEKETQGRGFDLVLSRPIGGLLNITRSSDICYFLIERLWEFLNKNNGTLYTQLPVISNDVIPHSKDALDRKVMAWAQLLERTDNLGVKFSDNQGLPSIHGALPVLRLRKTPNSPLRLPTLEGLNKALK